VADIRRPKFDPPNHLSVTVDGETVVLSPDDLAMIVQRLVQEGQLHVYSTNQDWLYSGSDVIVETDADGLIYLTPCDGVDQPAYALVVPEDRIDDDRR
jgi:hypothetical protein